MFAIKIKKAGNNMRKLELTHMRVMFGLATFLSLITIFAVAHSKEWTVRNIYNIIYFTFQNFAVFSINAMIFSRKKRFIPDNVRKILRTLVIVIYSFAYIIATLSYYTTGQITRIQTVLFLSKMNPFYIFAFNIGILVLIVAFIFFTIHKKTSISDSKKDDHFKIEFIAILSILLLFFSVLFNMFFLQIENPILKNDELLITYSSENLVLDELSKINHTYGKPNVIFILLESVSAEKLSTYAYNRSTSPNIDLLAEKSIVFENAYTTATHSEYAQPGLLSSRYIFNSDIRNSFDDNNPRKFIWDIFKENNYSTAYFSSQDDRWQNLNKYYDFSNLDTYSYSLSDGSTDYGSGFASKDFDFRTTAKALSWLNTSKDDPFFLFLNFQATHNPLVYPDNFSYFKPDDLKRVAGARGQKVNNKYDNALRYVDNQVGQIINFININNMSNNTIIAITSDHGHDLYNKHNIFGHGKSIYSEELLVPAIIYLPGVKANRVKDKVSHIDFVPTLIDLLGYPIPDEFQGDLMKKNRPLFFVTQSHKYQIGMIHNDIKVIIDMNRELIEVYNISSDPDELIKLDTKDYENEILQLLFWQYCQIDYYDNDKWNDFKVDRCAVNNNFKI